MCSKKAQGGAEGNSTYCSQEDPEIGPQNMQELCGQNDQKNMEINVGLFIPF